MLFHEGFEITCKKCGTKIDVFWASSFPGNGAIEIGIQDDAKDRFSSYQDKQVYFWCNNCDNVTKD